MIKSIVVASALAATVATSASAATISTDKDTCNNKQNGCHVITIQGDIQYGDDQKFDGELSRHPDLKVGVVALNSNGGNLDAALKIGRTIRKKNFATVAHEKCYSACAIIWVAGTYLQAYKASDIGFHSAATTTAQKAKRLRFNQALAMLSLELISMSLASQRRPLHS